MVVSVLGQQMGAHSMAAKSKKSIGPFGLGKTKRANVGGRPKQEDASLPMLAKRCKLAGLSVTPENIRQARAQWYGCNAGRAIAGESDREDLWAAIVHMRKVVAAYDRAIGAPMRHAKCLALLLPLDAMEASADSPAHDDRTDEEKSRDAVTAWTRLQGWLDHAKLAAGDTKRAVWDDAEVFDRGRLVEGLRAVVVGMRG